MVNSIMNELQGPIYAFLFAQGWSCSILEDLDALEELDVLVSKMFGAKISLPFGRWFGCIWIFSWGDRNWVGGGREGVFEIRRAAADAFTSCFISMYLLHCERAIQYCSFPLISENALGYSVTRLGQMDTLLVNNPAWNGKINRSYRGRRERADGAAVGSLSLMKWSSLANSTQENCCGSTCSAARRDVGEVWEKV